MQKHSILPNNSFYEYRHIQDKNVHKNLKKYSRYYNGKCANNKDKIKKSHIHTVQACLEIHLRELRSKRSKSNLYGFEEQCRFNTYNISLAKHLGCNPRTIKNHRQRLIEAGIILREYDHGQSGLTLHFNPLIIFDHKLLDVDEFAVEKYVDNLFKAQTRLEKIEQSEEKHSTFYVNSEKFSHIRTETSSKNKDNITKVDKLISGVLRTGILTKTLNKNIGDQGKTAEKKSGEILEKNERYSRSFSENKVAPGAGESPQQPAVFRILIPLINIFWLYAREKLYSAYLLNPEHEKEIKNLIYASCCKMHVGHKTEHEWEDYFKEMQTQVDIAADYFGRYKHLDKPDPWYYFSPPASELQDQEKEFKFYRTRAFLGKKLLHRCRKELEEFKRGKGRFKDRTRLDLCRLHTKRVVKFGDTITAKKFEKTLHLYH